MTFYGFYFVHRFSKSIQTTFWIWSVEDVRTKTDGPGESRRLYFAPGRLSRPSSFVGPCSFCKMPDIHKKDRVKYQVVFEGNIENIADIKCSQGVVYFEVHVCTFLILPPCSKSQQIKKTLISFPGRFLYFCQNFLFFKNFPSSNSSPYVF